MDSGGWISTGILAAMLGATRGIVWRRKLRYCTNMYVQSMCERGARGRLKYQLHDLVLVLNC